jgi:hypothetical protein
MQKVPLTNSETEKKDETLKENWADDQKERGYYYDDAHGYEQFDPESDDEPEEDESSSEDQR